MTSRMTFRGRPALRTAAVTVSLALLAAPASAQRADDDSRPGGVEARPSVPAPAGADMAPAPSQLFRKPTVTPPVLPAPAAPAAATAPAKPAAEKPAVPETKKSNAAPNGQQKPAADGKAKGTPSPADVEKLVRPPPASAPATRSMRAPSPRAGAPMPPGSFKGDDSLPGGVERAPGRE